jgi:hypothetical protein
MQEVQFLPYSWTELPRTGKTEKGASRCDYLFELRLAKPHPTKKKKGDKES